MPSSPDARPRTPLRRLAQRLVFNHWAPMRPFPKAREVSWEDAWFTTVDGVRLHAGWFRCPDDIPAPLGQPRPTVLFFHGNNGSVPRWRHVGARWQDAIGADVLLVDYRGYGQSGGRPTEAGVALDARAAHAHLVQERGVDPARLVICGQSLGGGVAVELATSGVPHAALVLESTFTDIRAVADHMVSGLGLGRFLDPHFPSAARLGGYDRPLFISHGSHDWLIPLAHARALHDAAVGPRELLVLDGMRHYDVRPPSYQDAVRDFLRLHL